MWAAASDSAALLGRGFITVMFLLFLCPVHVLWHFLLSAFIFLLLRFPPHQSFSACPPFTLRGKCRFQSCVDNGFPWYTKNSMCKLSSLVYKLRSLYGSSCWKFAAFSISRNSDPFNHNKEESNKVDLLTSFVNHSEQECVWSVNSTVVVWKLAKFPTSI